MTAQTFLSTCTANDLLPFLERRSNSSWVSGSAVCHYTTAGFALIARFTAQIKTILYELSLMLIVKGRFPKILMNYKLGYMA